MNYDNAIGLVRFLLESGESLENALGNSAVPKEFKDRIKLQITEEQNIILEPARMITNKTESTNWLLDKDRSDWYYWSTLRRYLLLGKRWTQASVRSLDRETDRILSQLSPPNESEFDVRGLVLGYVQSGKTSNYTALISKAVSLGYRLVIVLTGMDNGLRLQTQRRLKRELVGGSGATEIPLPPIGKRWHEFTRNTNDGDFRPGWANAATLQGSEPVLLVIKKNHNVLERLLSWLENAPQDVKDTIPTLVIDDEADLASVDTRGTRQTIEEPAEEDYEDPSKINKLIRKLLSKFKKKNYVAYTATPFANILIPHDNYDPTVQDDLYPRDFIVDLPKPHGYFGAEELFGRMDDSDNEFIEGIDAIRHVSDTDIIQLQEFQVPNILDRAMLSFILAGAAREHRGLGHLPATMLIHISFKKNDHHEIRKVVQERFNELKDDWRYDKDKEIKERLISIWEKDFIPLTNATHPELNATFEEIEPLITNMFEAVTFKTLNSDTEDILDYDLEPSMKCIAIGGNKLSRGLTLEGLLVSIFVRRSATYDTLMQMGRWFGYRGGYEDLTRIYTTSELADWFADLAQVEHMLRNDIAVYEEQQLTPLQVGMRIKTHSTMQVTSRMKRRFATETTIAQSYSGLVQQTFKFPLDNLDNLSYICESNLILVKKFLPGLGEFEMGDKGPIWKSVNVQNILSFLEDFKIDDRAHGLSIPLIKSYIERARDGGELSNWTVAICGRTTENVKEDLGTVDWGIPGVKINQIKRTRIRDTNSLGVITNPGDEAIGLDAEKKIQYEEKIREEESEKKKQKKNVVARRFRSPQEGLLLLYPISKKSQPLKEGVMRRPLYENTSDPRAKDLIGLAISFPHSEHPQPVEAYLEGSVGWKVVE